MFMRFDDWKAEIKAYCENNALDYEKARRSRSSNGFDNIYLQDYDRDPNVPVILGGEPAPITLIIEKQGDGVVFKQTEHTRKYLSI